jgi:small-conductance mechanosensitive channel
MGEFIKIMHNLTRWVVLAGGLWAIILAYRGLFRRGDWSLKDTYAGLTFTASLHLQLLLGLLLYLVSPFMQALLQNVGEAMRDSRARFFLIEHLTLMVLAIIAAQLGYSLAKRAQGNRTKFVRATVGYTIAGVLIVIGIPWWRPLFPGL